MIIGYTRWCNMYSMTSKQLNRKAINSFSHGNLKYVQSDVLDVTTMWHQRMMPHPRRCHKMPWFSHDGSPSSSADGRSEWKWCHAQERQEEQGPNDVEIEHKRKVTFTNSLSCPCEMIDQTNPSSWFNGNQNQSSSLQSQPQLPSLQATL